MLAALLGTCLVALLGACAAPERPETAPEKAPLAYPPAPEKPRFFYERSIFGTASVVEFTEEMSLRQALTGSVGVKNEPLGKPFSIAVHRGRVFVSDSTKRAIFLFDYQQKKAVKFGNLGEGALAVPLGMDTDADGNLYVTDVSQRRVVVYDRDGNYLRTFGGKALLDRPSGVAVTPDGSRAFVTDTGGVTSENHRIVVFDPRSGAHLSNIGSRGTGPGQFNLLREVALGPDGRLYVVDGGNFRVQVLEQDGTFVREFGQAGRQFGQFARPKGIDVGPDGNVYVVDAAFGNFQIFSPDGQLLLFVGQRANKNAPGIYALPAGIEVDEDGRIYVVEQFFSRVDIFRPAELAIDAGYLVTGPSGSTAPARGTTAPR